MDEVRQIVTTSAMLLSAFFNMGNPGSTAQTTQTTYQVSHTVPLKSSLIYQLNSQGAAQDDSSLKNSAGKSSSFLTISSRILSEEGASDDNETPDALQEDDGAKVPTAAYSLTDSERDMVERVVMTSCGSLRNLKMAEANAQVILDRVKSGRFGNTVTAVVTAPHQFEKLWKGNVNDVVKEAVSAVFDDGVRVIDQPVYYYLNPHDAEVLKNVWAKNKVYVTTIGTGRFIHQYWTSK